jgi:hypothetical protein
MGGSQDVQSVLVNGADGVVALCGRLLAVATLTITEGKIAEIKRMFGLVVFLPVRRPLHCFPTD